MPEAKLDLAARAYDQIAATSGPPLRIVTRCATVDEFIASFRRLVSEHHMLVALKVPRQRGDLVRFSLQLADGTPVFQGIGRIIDIYAARAGRAGGVKIELVLLDEESRTMHLCLLMASKPVPATPSDAQQLALELRRGMRDTVPMSGDLLAQVTLAPPEPPAALPPPPEMKPKPPPTPRAEAPPVERRAGSELQLPANPLGELSPESLDQFIECGIYEDPGTYTPLAHPAPPLTQVEAPAAPATPASAVSPAAPIAASAPAVTPAVPAAPVVARSRTPKASRAQLPIGWILLAVALAAALGIGAAYLLWGGHG